MDSILQITLMMLIVFLASMVRGSTGFGLAMVSMPLLTLFLPYKEVVVLVVILNFAFSVFHIIRSHGTLETKHLILIVIFSISGVSIGILLLNNLESLLLKIFAGIIIILFGLAMLSGYKLKFRNLSGAFTLASISGGILAGAASIGGPAAAIILGGTNMKPERFRYAMSVFFLVSYSYSSIMHGVTGNIDRSIIIRLLITIPVMFAGLIIGDKLANKLNTKVLQIIVLCMLIVAGATITIQGLIQL